MNKKIHPVVIKNNSFGDLNGATIYVTQDLFERLTEESESDKALTLADLQSGRALRGLKHLMERILKRQGEPRLILTLGPSARDGNSFYINFDDYRQSTQGQFFDMYRSVGLEVSLRFLHSQFPEDFATESGQLSEAQLRAAQRDLPNLVEQLAKRKRNQPVLMDGITSILRGLQKEHRLLQQERKSLEGLRSQSNMLFYQKSVEELRRRLESDKRFDETRGRDSWQRWIYGNSWLLGATHLEPIDRQRVGMRDVPDFVFPTLDGFIDIVEIKRPDRQAIREDSSRPNVCIWTADATQAIGQVTKYKQQVDLHQLELTKDLGVTALKPRGFVLIGTEDGWTNRMREGFRLLNSTMIDIEVITYDELLRRGQRIIELYND